MAEAAKRRAEPDAQDGLFDQELDNELLLAALERRQASKEKLAPVRKAAKEANDAVKGILAGLELGEETVARCGRFRITKKPVAARDVSFSTDPTSRLTIGLIEGWAG